jgi:hypothetical protein
MLAIAAAVPRPGIIAAPAVAAYAAPAVATIAAPAVALSSVPVVSTGYQVSYSVEPVEQHGYKIVY